MVRSLSSGWQQPRQRGNDDEFAQLQGGQDNPLAGLGQIVLVGVSNRLDEAMHVQAFEQARELRPGVVRQDAPQATVAEAAELPCATRQGEEESEVVGAEQLAAARRA